MSESFLFHILGSERHELRYRQSVRTRRATSSVPTWLKCFCIILCMKGAKLVRVISSLISLEMFHVLLPDVFQLGVWFFMRSLYPRRCLCAFSDLLWFGNTIRWYSFDPRLPSTSSRGWPFFISSAITYIFIPFHMASSMSHWSRYSSSWFMQCCSLLLAWKYQSLREEFFQWRALVRCIIDWVGKSLQQRFRRNGQFFSLSTRDWTHCMTARYPAVGRTVQMYYFAGLLGSLAFWTTGKRREPQEIIKLRGWSRFTLSSILLCPGLVILSLLTPWHSHSRVCACGGWRGVVGRNEQ